MKNPARMVLFVALVILAHASTAQAGSLTVAPVRVVLSDTDKVQTVTVRNNGTGATRVQLRVFAWRQVAGEDVLDETRDILVNPVTFELASGTEQIARFGLRIEQGAVEKSYRVVIDEVPGDRASQPGEIRTLLRIVMPIFVTSTVPAPRLTWSLTDHTNLTLHNRGNTHLQIRRLSVTGANDRPIVAHDMSAYLLAGTTRKMSLALASSRAPGERLTVNALTDAAANPVAVDREADADPTPKP